MELSYPRWLTGYCWQGTTLVCCFSLWDKQINLLKCHSIISLSSVKPSSKLIGPAGCKA